MSDAICWLFYSPSSPILSAENRSLILVLAKNSLGCTKYSILPTLCTALMPSFALQKEAMYLRDKVDDAIQQVEEKLGMEDFTEMDETEVTHKIHTLYRETLLRCYNFGCEVNDSAL